MPIATRPASHDVRLLVGEGEMFSLSSYRDLSVAKAVENYAIKLLYEGRRPLPHGGELPTLSEKRRAYVERRIEILLGPEWGFKP